MNSTTPYAEPQGIHHVRLTVTDIARSKEFYTRLLGRDPQVDMSDQADDPGALADPERLYAGCVFELGDQLLGLRPVARAGDTFEPDRVGLDHISLAVPALEELRRAAERLDQAGVTNGGVQELEDMGLAILSVQDPDNINLELSAPLPG